MRTILILAFSLGLVLGSSFLLLAYLNHSTQQLTVHLTQLEKKINQQNWQESETILKNWQRDWMKIQNIWALFIDHQEIDNIEVSLNRMKSYISSQNLDLALGELSALDYWITHIPDKESLNWENIF